ncbi:S1 family peptidase [Burkholderia sp. AU31624]|uniref:S1 family peptidase n=1 Tax=Burkholderia sp. AU31624 TaxID=2879629 RepID=UPI001CF10610|nr:S1 family peptidase [Burkholderia sp. AU31624]MCA8257591.1 S1 family peptidase [Burkholderia sp. AU31624]
MASVRDAAVAFKIWAVEHRLFSAQLGPTDTAIDPVVVRAVAQAFDIESQAVQKAVFARRVTLVAYNEADRQIRVYLNRGFTKTIDAKLPKRIADVEVAYFQGTIGQIGPVPTSLAPSPAYRTAAGKYTCGSSIFPGGRTGAGTLGAIINVANQAVLFGLSNNHVAGQCNYSDLDHPIVAPGSIDIRAGFIDPFTIGHFARSCPMQFGTPDNVPTAANLDASIFSLKDVANVSSYQGTFYDTPPNVVPMADNLEVKKVGRTTGLTHGRVVGKLAGPIPVGVSVAELGLQSQVYFENAWVVEGRAGAFSDRGDSGSLIVTEDGTAAVGLLFAGDGSITLALPLQDVLAHFGATLATGL